MLRNIDKYNDEYNTSKRPLYICYVDVKSAFNFIIKHDLWFKIMSQGFNGKQFQLLQSLFSKTSSRVKWNSELD